MFKKCEYVLAVDLAARVGRKPDTIRKLIRARGLKTHVVTVEMRGRLWRCLAIDVCDAHAIMDEYRSGEMAAEKMDHR